RQPGKRRQRHRGAARRVRGHFHGGRDRAREQPRRQPGAGGVHLRRDQTPAREVSEDAVVCGGHGYVRLGLLLRAIGGRQDLRGSRQRGRLHRRTDERFRLRRYDEEVRRRAAAAYRRRAQRFSRPVLADERFRSQARAGDFKSRASTVHRARAGGARPAAERNQGNVFGAVLDRRGSTEARPDRRLRQRQLRGARSDRRRGYRGLHAARRRVRSRRAPYRDDDGANAEQRAARAYPDVALKNLHALVLEHPYETDERQADQRVGIVAFEAFQQGDSQPFRLHAARAAVRFFFAQIAVDLCVGQFAELNAKRDYLDL